MNRSLCSCLVLAALITSVLACGDSPSGATGGTGGNGSGAGGNGSGGNGSGGNGAGGNGTGGSGTGGVGGLNGEGGFGGAGGTIEGHYHPTGFVRKDMHGPFTNLQLLDCRECHGALLDGGTSGVACDDCHSGAPGAWREDCIYCHGGTDNDTGAPPRGLRGDTNRNAATFKAHTAHVTESNHPAYECTQCHVQPRNVLSSNHVFDSTAGKAEVDFTAGLSPAGTHTPGSCANLYCHGNGRSGLGSYQDSQPTPGCNDCHGADAAHASSMSGDHSRHVLRAGLACSECHGPVVNSAKAIIGPTLHVNGQVDTNMTAGGFTTSNGSNCTGTCHNKRHSSERW